MNKQKISVILLAVALIITVVTIAFIYADVAAKNAELDAKNAEIEAKDEDQTNDVDSQVEDQNDWEIDDEDDTPIEEPEETDDNNPPVEEQTGELDDKDAVIAAKDAEIARLKEPKVSWDLSYEDVRQEMANPGYHLTVTGTIINYGVTDVYNLQLHVVAYYVTGELAINKLEPPGPSERPPDLPAGTIYEVGRWVYYEPGLIDTVSITPVWDLSP
ncbi:MAG: hypothetical protein NWF06_10485 [Candidatus Bathyarchaeota archaeon]|nr:hypothetical protein [Candidatus Bathyarchaeum sp.]